MTWAKRRALVIIILIVLIAIGIWLASSTKRIPPNSVLVLDISGSIEEQRADGLLSAINGTFVPVLHDYTDEIDTARGDSQIAGLVVKIGPIDTGWAKLEEIRSHILEFRKSGKPSICFLDDDGIGNPEYYLATSCQQVWLMPTTPIGVRGMMAEATFLRGTLDKLKIVPDFYHIAEYKTATNELTEKKFTPAHHEEVDSLLHSVYDHYLDDVSASRQMSRSDFEALVNQGPFEAEDALQDKLVDKLAYWDEVQQFFKSRVKTWDPVDIGQYRGRVQNTGSSKIAVVHATGLITSGESTVTPGGFVMGGDSVSADIRKARQDSSIRAIILRIDSGGGLAVASEEIRREVALAAKAKPVVVSMSDVAASGGYWIAAPATKIIADPETITASIGVLTGKLNLAGLYGMLGVSTDYIATSDNATIDWDQQNFTPAQQKSIQHSLDVIYANFTKGVGEGRHMTAEAVDKIGKGRVWSGEQAKQNGLVDDLGGFDRALAVAKQLAHIPAQQSVTIERFPREKSFFEQILQREEDGGEMRVADARAGVKSIFERLGFSMDPIQVRMPFDLRIR